MENFICKTCGVQYEATVTAPEKCVICTEERQYISPSGQTWTTLKEMGNSGLRNVMVEEEKGLFSIKTEPSFAIGQNAFFVENKGVNLLWDCITYLDEPTVKKLSSLGGVQAIALSHPHYYSTQVEWAETFDAPIYIHEDDKQWVMRPSERIRFWQGESLVLSEDFVLHRLGGHFKGGTILEWKAGYDGKGVLLTGDIIQVVADQRWVSFMYSYPNLIPLPPSKVEEMAARVRALKFQRLYNAFQRKVKEDAHAAVQRSAERYINAVEGRLFET